MPVYDTACDSDHACGHFADVIILLADLDEAVCPSCGGPIRRLPRPVRTVGPMPSKPLTISQIGRSFTSPAQLREYKKSKPNAEFHAPDSIEWKNKVDRVRKKAEDRVKAWGYADREDYQKRRFGKTPDGRKI